VAETFEWRQINKSEIMFKSIVNSCYFENKDIWKERNQMD
jgi:hypothetical protein